VDFGLGSLVVGLTKQFRGLVQCLLAARARARLVVPVLDGRDRARHEQLDPRAEHADRDEPGAGALREPGRGTQRGV